MVFRRMGLRGRNGGRRTILSGSFPHGDAPSLEIDGVGGAAVRSLGVCLPGRERQKPYAMEVAGSISSNEHIRSMS